MTTSPYTDSEKKAFAKGVALGEEKMLDKMLGILRKKEDEFELRLSTAGQQ